MKICPVCAEENSIDSLFCKGCGRCLLAPDPEVVPQIKAMPVQHQELREVSEFYHEPITKPSGTHALKRKEGLEPAVMTRRLLFLNLLAIALVVQIVSYLLIK